ncbi:TPA: hypothetical protein VBA85_001826 [Streptococcus agalactiae]|nr:hypothetical protein [Streptococcus agalactiae]
MSSEQQERLAIQYAERAALFTLRSFIKLLEWSVKYGLAQDSAYKIGVQKLEELLQSPYAIEQINLSQDLQDKPIDIEKLQEELTKEGFPIAVAWQGDSLYFYSKDKSLLDKHLEGLLKHFMEQPDKLKELSLDKSLDQEIQEAKEQIKVKDNLSVKEREMVL